MEYKTLRFKITLSALWRILFSDFVIIVSETLIKICSLLIQRRVIHVLTKIKHSHHI